MNVQIAEDTLGLEDASARLAQLEQSEAADVNAIAPNQEQRETPAEAGGGGPAAAAADKNAQNPPEKKTDTPAAPDAKAPEAAKPQDNQNGKPADQAAADKKSPYAKSQERLEKTWDSVNKRKGELDARDQQMQQREHELQQREENFRRQTEESQTQYKPEEVQAAAQRKLDRAKELSLQADGLESQAEKLKDDGKYEEAAQARAEAKKLRKQANKEEGNAEDLQAHAEQLRKNPPASFAQREQAVEKQRKEWTTKAATDFPDLAKKDSPLQQKVAQTLNELWNTDRTLASHPQIIYHVTRLAAAETAAARVPDLEKQLGELKAKVQDYEKLTSPGSGGAAQRIDTANQPKNDADERAELGQLAEAVGAFR
jgi:DNA repair exonuclease SbcCD ATPase subunit